MSKGLLHHIEIYVSNLEKSIDFWGWFLEEMGYYLYQEWESGRSWKNGETYIVFVQANSRFLKSCTFIKAKIRKLGIKYK